MQSKKDNKYIRTYQPNQNSSLGFSIWKDMFSELSQSKELIMRLSLRDFSARYKQSVLGILWTFIMPLFIFRIFVRNGSKNSTFLDVLNGIFIPQKGAIEMRCSILIFV
ncbi:MAG: hypothetical protein L6282_06350 [Candidatus Methanoperedenaceae archaeon]|nr:hypothetical protein [Candidatus Methanoperedenaceae archaeon]